MRKIATTIFVFLLFIAAVSTAPAQTPTPTPTPNINAADGNGDTQLIRAARARDIQLVTTTVQAGANVNIANLSGSTALHEAVRGGVGRIVDILLEKGANANARDRGGNTPVTLAIDTRNNLLLDTLLAKGGDSNAAAVKLLNVGDEYTFRSVVDRYRVKVTNEMFATAVRDRRFGLMEMMMTKGVDKNYALDMALKNNIRELIEPALRAGANPNPALQYAMDRRDTSLAILILNNYNGDANLALKLAIANNDVTIVQMALSRGANSNQGLAAAARAGNQQMVEIMLTTGRADPNSGLMPAVEGRQSRIIEYLISKGANPSPAMPFAVDSQDIPLLKMLMNANGDSRNPVLMDTAARRGNLEITKMLLAAGADPNAGVMGAIRASNLNLTIFLLDNKADPRNSSFIDAAASLGNNQIAAMLIERGADPNTGMLGAVQGGHVGMVDLLLRNKAQATDPRLISRAAEKADLATATVLLKAGAAAENGIKAGVLSGSAEMVALLIENGAKATDPAYILGACTSANLRLTEVLLKNGAPAGALDATGQPLIIIAALTWKPELIKLLLDNGVDANAKNQAGDTAMHIVVMDKASQGYPAFPKKKAGRFPVLNALIAGKADVNAKNAKGESIMKVTGFFDGDVKKILKAAGASK